MDCELSNYGGSETVLIVDDDKHVLNFLSALMSGNGYNVITARDGKEAVEAYIENSQNISIVLMDIVMPHKDGISASVEMMEHSSDANIILMSGFSPDSKGKIICSKFIKKPFSALNVIKMVRDHLDGNL